MMKLHLLIAILLVLPLRVIGCPLEGYWKSDEEKTLASFRQAKDVTPKQMEVFENNFFGKLFMHIECRKFTSVMDDWIEISSYELVSSSSKSVIIRYTSELEGEVVREAKIEGNCYSLEINGGQFKEYFCPVSAKAYNKAIKFAQQAAPDGQ
ncbi:hypothetical protein EDC56_1773 [Sinobacterium caligoides]|uniref:Uncharacterized protein n=1 Tax=Sinobacterium caligoides TaxID=933926 RepID=A0A3N2DNF2_9GAMM|nr:hypothetical protein [Sinobacterium caligoides]ROS01338.1 hypothetical protein EDC56_1773 [Sinobacterium caligoides]